MVAATSKARWPGAGTAAAAAARFRPAGHRAACVTATRTQPGSRAALAPRLAGPSDSDSGSHGRLGETHDTVGGVIEIQ
jgi:hypothetical protein